MFRFIIGLMPFQPGNKLKLSRGRPPGSRNKPLPPEVLDLEPRSPALAYRANEFLTAIIADLGGRDAMSAAQMLLAQRWGDDKSCT
jgi:hypothetical protein